MEKLSRSYFVQSVHRAIEILKLLSDKSPLTVSEIGRLIQTPKTTCFMILQTLEDDGLIERMEDGKYRTGSGLFDLVFGSQFLNVLRNVGTPLLQELSSNTKMTSHLAVKEGLETVYVAKVDGPGFVQFSTFVGQRIPLYLSGVGKAYMMNMSNESIIKMFPEEKFSSRYANTIANRTQLLEQIEEARVNGYAFEDEEGELGIRCVGVPIINSRGHTLGAISVTALKEQLPAAEYAAFGQQIKEIADRLVRDLQVYDLKQLGH